MLEICWFQSAFVPELEKNTQQLAYESMKIQRILTLDISRQAYLVLKIR